MKTINIVLSQELALPPALPYVCIFNYKLYENIQSYTMTKNSIW